ncbi:hypothetical protein PtrM4_073640 [Pyrenophora tritici-repentis]|uniref:Peptidase A2 domain-containing protein n=1 Tax=Pyrenophora tritici-repentis TaxID=45151 RepID=A0A834VTR3_9PLEO|nr:hypothetical protein PtrM4_073640 [Pyrenophora tritici-repentis]
MPRMKSSRTASSYEDMDVEEEPEVLRHRAQVEIDDSQQRDAERDSRSATVDYDVIPAPAPVPKASRAFAPVTIPTTEDLAAMAQNTAPTVLAKAMLNQEVRGIRQLDLLASPEVAAAVTKALEEARRPRVHFQVDETRSGETMEIQQANNNKSDDEKADSDEDGSIEEAVQRLYDWGSGDTCVVETESSQPEVITKGILTQLCPKMDRSRKIDRVGVGEANELHDFQNYEISDEEDGYVEAQSRMPSEARLKGELQQQQYSVKGQLPTCWVSLHGGMGRALIDTGSQLNVMRLSTARALNVYITELDQSGLPPELQQGMITADGGMDPFVGTAYSVPIAVGGIIVPTHFRIVRRLRRAILLGTPWCATARLQIQFDTVGRTLCYIKSMDGRREVSFIGCDPAPTANAASIEHQGKG